MISKDSKTLQVTLPKKKYEFLEMVSAESHKTKSKWIEDLVTMLYGLMQGDIEIIEKKQDELKKGENRNA